jgi:hypothetical protein
VWGARYTLGARYLSNNTLFLSGKVQMTRNLKIPLYALGTIPSQLSPQDLLTGRKTGKSAGCKISVSFL